MGLTNTPDFIKTTQEAVLSLFIQNYEDAYFQLTGKTIELHPAQAEQLLVNSGSYMVWLNMLKMQSAALQGLPQFATYPVLDYIAQPFGVTRLAAQPSKCTIQFSLIAGHGDLVIPAGTRVQSQDGLSNFATQSDIPVVAGVNTITAIVVCDTPGVAANGYVAGKVSIILDPQAYLTAAVNVDTTNGGSDIESDASLRSRLFVSNAAFSTCGSDDGYIFYAKSASPLILDVFPANSGNGQVNLYVLVAGGATPPEILADVEAACSPKNRRPTSDTVNALSPTIAFYDVVYDIVAYSNVPDTAALVAQSQAAVRAVTDRNSQNLGIDIILSEIVAAAKVDGVADIIIHSPSANSSIDKTQATVCNSIAGTLTGLNNDR